jgi:ABC-type nickel/cobalt efflux system permease component RcnA
MSTMTILAIVVAIMALAVAAWALYQVQTTRRLRSRFGPEYDYTVAHAGDRRSAESELAQREARVKKYPIRALTREERDRFSNSWREQQSRFVDDPRGAISAADVLITEVMTTRGYPVSDFQTQLSDASVDHPHLVSKYREAHEIAERNRNGTAGTEDLRQAMICYRALFEDLIDARITEDVHQEVRR